MFVITADQRRSTEHGDRVEQILAAIRDWSDARRSDIVLDVERTVGDEVQLVLASAGSAVDLGLMLMRAREWSVGIGTGEVDLPLGDSARASSGEAFVHARRAVERAKGKGEPAPIVVSGPDAGGAEAATALTQLLASVVRRRSDAGWEVADLLDGERTQKDIAQALGISEQAVSQRIASAMIDEERRARPVAAMLLERASGGIRP